MFENYAKSLTSWHRSRFTQNDLPGMRWGKEKDIPQLLEARIVFGVNAPDRINKLIRIFNQIRSFSVLLIQTSAARVSVIISKRIPLKVAEMVVSFVAIFVINGFSKLLNAKKGFRNNPMQCCFNAAVESNANIAGIGQRSAHHASRQRSSPSIFVNQSPSQASYAPMTRDFIARLKLTNWFPYFGIHAKSFTCLGSLT